MQVHVAFTVLKWAIKSCLLRYFFRWTVAITVSTI